jgi:hypothetical protein
MRPMLFRPYTLGALRLGGDGAPQNNQKLTSGGPNLEVARTDSARCGARIFI